MKKNLKFALKFAYLLFIRNLKTTIFIVLIFSLILALPTLTKSITDGFGAKIKKEINDFIGDFIIKSENGEDLSEIYPKLNQMPFIKFYIPIEQRRVLIKDKNNNIIGSEALIIDNFERFIELNQLKKHLIEGEIQYGKEGVIIGIELTKEGKFKKYQNPLEVKEGDNLKIYFENKEKNMKLQGIYSKGPPSLNFHIFINSKNIDDFKPNKILIYLDDNYKNKIDWVYKELLNEFPKYTIHSMKEEMVTIDSFLRTFSLISSITFIFGTLIAIIIIYSLISINVRNKRSEIGILRALGIKENNLVLVYLFLTTFYLISSFVLSLFILKLFGLFFEYKPINSPFGFIVPKIDYYFFIKNFIKLAIFLIITAYIPIKGVIKEDLINQIRS